MSAMRIVYLSPHLDDAVLSAGGLIREQAASGCSVEIWTVMAGAPASDDVPEFARAMHQIWGFESAQQAVQLRRQEDDRAAAEVGARSIHLDFLDCIYRRGPQGEGLYSDVTVPIHPDDADLPGRIAHALAARLRPDDLVICQLGIGRHVDHLIVRQAAEMLHRPLKYDADVPYLLDHPEELEPLVKSMRASMKPISQAAFRGWLSAIECYASQVDSVFGSRELMLERMQAYWTGQGGIRLWAPRSWWPGVAVWWNGLRFGAGHQSAR